MPETLIIPNFRSPSSIAALTKACLLSKFVKEVAALPSSAAYLCTAGSILVKIPSSSKSSGSSLAVPRNSRCKASVKFLPKALDALRDTKLSLSICSVLNPADNPMLTF